MEEHKNPNREHKRDRETYFFLWRLSFYLFSHKARLLDEKTDNLEKWLQFIDLKFSSKQMDRRLLGFDFTMEGERKSYDMIWESNCAF